MSKTLTIGEIIDRVMIRDGRKQSWVVQKMNMSGCKITEVQFSRKKNGHENFTENEIKVLREILKIDRW